MVVIELIFSKISPPLMSIPYEAATPVPTITAVGVARPSAHGQAITNAEIPKLNANWNLVYPLSIICSMPALEYE
jgi:hypothetical protein